MRAGHQTRRAPSSRAGALHSPAMVLHSIVLYLTSLSLTTLLLLAGAALLALTLRRKGYGVTLRPGSLEITALRGSRRFPDGARVRVATRLAHCVLSGFRGPWLDLSTARFVMRLRPAPPASARPAAASSALRRSFARLSAALAVDAAYSRVVAHNFAVSAVVFFLRGVRLRAERVHVWRQGAHWAFKADQFVYTGHAVGVFGSRYDVSVNELSLLADRYPVGVTPPAEAEASESDDGGSGDRNSGDAVGGASRDAAAADPAAQLATAFAAAASARSSEGELDSARLFMSVPEDHAAMPQPTLTPHTSSAAITTFVPPQRRLARARGVAHVSRPTAAPGESPPLPAAGAAPGAGLPTPLRLSLVLRKGVHMSALLAPRVLTVFRPRRMAIMDDITLTLDVRDVSARASHVASLKLESANITLCPGFSRSLRAKLPPSAPSTRRPRKPGLLRYWEASGNFTGVYARLVPPPMPTAPHLSPRSGGSVRTDLSTSSLSFPSSQSPSPPAPGADLRCEGGLVGGGGLFANVKSASFEACGMAADERQEAMSKASLTIDHVFAGSTAVESSAQEHCESLARFAPPLPQSPRTSPLDRRKSRSLRSEGVRWMDEEAVRGEIGDSEDEEDEEGRRDRGNGARSDSGSESGDYSPPPLEPDAVLALEAFVKSRPEAVLWLAGISASFDMNCAKRDVVRFDIGGDGAVVAIEPAGLLRIARNAMAFSRGYTVTSAPEAAVAVLTPAISPAPADPQESPLSLSSTDGRRGSLAAATLSQPLLGASQASMSSSGHLGNRSTSGDMQTGISRSASVSSVGSEGADSGERGALMFGCDLKRCHAIVLGDGPVGEGDTLAVIFGAEKVTVPRMIRSGVKDGGFRVVCEVDNLRVDHWSQWARTANLVCEHGAFSNMSKSSTERREVSVFGLSMDWDLDLQSALEELPERFRRLAKVSRDPALADYTRALYLHAVSSGSSSSTPPLAGFTSPASSVSSLPAKMSSRSSSVLEGSYLPVTLSPSGAARVDSDAAALAEVEKRERRERRRKRFLQVLDSWMLSGTDVCVAASFPDGPRMSAHAAEVPSFYLSDDRYVVRHMVVELSGTKFMYAKEFSVRNPIHSMGRSSERRHIDVDVTTFRALLAHEYWFGLLLQDWIIRLKAVLKVSREARYRRRGIPMPRYRKKSFPDIHLGFTGIEVAIQDHPLDAFLTKALPLMQDEALERVKRYQALGEAVMRMRQNSLVSMERIRQLKYALAEEDSAIYIRRMKAHMISLDEWDVAPGFLPGLHGPPQSQLSAASLRLELTMDDATRKLGSSENIRMLKLLDTYLLGPQKHKKVRQYESDAWNSLGFRDVVLDATSLELRFRDFPKPFMTVDRLYFDTGTVVGQGQEAMLAPFLTEATVAIGRRRMVKIEKSVASSKTFADIHLIADTMCVTYNPAYIGAVMLFGRSFGRFLAGGKNPSERMAWFDTTRASQHGQFRITARSLKGVMTSSASPYTDTNHYVNIAADDVSMLMSRRPPTERDQDPISWEVHNWRFYPSIFREDMRSAIAFKFVKVGLNPVPQSLSGDPQDHYIFPLTTKEQAVAGGTGIGRAVMTPFRVSAPVSARLNQQGCYTEWMSPLLTDGNPSYDSYTQFCTDSLHLGIRVVVQQAPDVIRPASRTAPEPSPLAPPHRADCEDSPAFWAPEGASVVHSDAITTIMKVVGRITHRPISNRAPVRWNFPGRKVPNPSGLGHRMTSSDLDVEVSDLNVMLYNNFESGHGLFVALRSICGGMSKSSVRIACEKPGTVSGYAKETKVVRQSAELDDFFIAMRIPGLDFADEATECGSLFSLQSLRLSRQEADAKSILSSSPRFNDGSRTVSRTSAIEGLQRGRSEGLDDVNEKSPFYTFSSNHDLQRGKALDQVNYKQVLSIDGVRIFWSPSRRNSLLSWPDAFAEKSFVMKGASSSGRSVLDLRQEGAAVPQRVVNYSNGAALPAHSVCKVSGDINTSEQAAMNGELERADAIVADCTDGVELQRLEKTSSFDPDGMIQFDSGGARGRDPTFSRSSDSETFSVDNDGSDDDGDQEGPLNSAEKFPVPSRCRSEDLPESSPATSTATTNRRRRRALAVRNRQGSSQSKASIRRIPTAGDIPVPTSTRLTAAKKADGDLIDLIEPRLVEELASGEVGDIGKGKVFLPEQVFFVRPSLADRQGSMRSLSHDYLQDSNMHGQCEGLDDAPRTSALATSLRSVLDTNAKFQLMVTDSQICFGAPDADALVLLTSESASIGFVDKTIEQKHQLGGSSEKWIDAEYRVLLQRSRVYVLSDGIESFRFHERWVPREADTLRDEAEIARAIAPLTRLTVKPISFNVMYIRAKSIVRNDDDDDADNVLRPSQLYINVPYVSMDSTRSGFLAVTDVVRKVLMLRVPNSEVIKDELALLRYNMQLAGGQLSTSELEDYGRRLNNITKQFLYAGETFQPHLVDAWIRPEDGNFASNFLRYKARAKAVATFMRSERRASGTAQLFPTMYISYSFDQCSWQLRDFKTNKPFVEITMSDLVCRHIFYVGKGMSSEFTFKNINAINHQEGGFYKGILHPSKPPGNMGTHMSSKIKASDGTSVAFRWFTTQMESVGGIPVYDLLTINLSPLNAAISSTLSKAVFEFAFGSRDITDVRKIVKGGRLKGSGSNASAVTGESASGQAERPGSKDGLRGGAVSTSGDSLGAGSASLPVRRSESFSDVPTGRSGDKQSSPASVLGVANSSAPPRRNGPSRRRRGADEERSRVSTGNASGERRGLTSFAPLHARTRSQDVQEMSQRGQSTMIFKYIYIGEFQLTASYKQKEDPEAHSILDITDLTVNSPSYMYSSQVWTWRNFAQQVKKELLVSFAVRGVSNLAKLKLLPGYQRIRRRLKQGTDTVNEIRQGLFDRSSGQSLPDVDVVYGEEFEGSERGGRTDSLNSGSDDENGHDKATARSMALSHELLGTSAQDDEQRRRLVLQVLFGSRSEARFASAHDTHSSAVLDSAHLPNYSDASSLQSSGGRPPPNPRHSLRSRGVRPAFLHRRGE